MSQFSVEYELKMNNKWIWIKILETSDITFHVYETSWKHQHWIWMVQKQNKQMTTGVGINFSDCVNSMGVFEAKSSLPQ